MFGCHNRILQSQNYTPQWHVYRHIGCPIIGFSNPTIGCPIIGLGNPTIGHPTCYTINATLGHPTVIAMSGTDSGMRFVMSEAVLPLKEIFMNESRRDVNKSSSRLAMRALDMCRVQTGSSSSRSMVNAPASQDFTLITLALVTGLKLTLDNFVLHWSYPWMLSSCEVTAVDKEMYQNLISVLQQ
ncbi:hypothetical protein V9T40_010865 [Parthenolecanium corni]|uniref:Uncharacterized protein n=1 Tax=Parthenolecanium corni TaxID=536013 RepID=A0AAN9XY11_9HEMI